jgi:hypothetical protein
MEIQTLGAIAISIIITLAVLVVIRRSILRARAPPPQSGDNHRCAIVVGGTGYECEVVGESKYQRDLEIIAGGRTENGARHKCVAVLYPEPNNPADKSAIRVEIDGCTVGYLPRKLAREFSGALSAESFEVAVCNAMIVGGWRASKRQKEGHFGVVLDASVPFEFDVAPNPRI